jgi:hypothetical protein
MSDYNARVRLRRALSQAEGDAIITSICRSLEDETSFREIAGKHGENALIRARGKLLEGWKAAVDRDRAANRPIRSNPWYVEGVADDDS